ncbi:MAG: Ig-like domain-containing protein [Bacilli bacterium]|jgi:hypothetical protein|nr:Ig-like domain-containing protein [Bacilli bacterium]
MLTKTRKWLVVFAVAIVALFVSACKPTEEDPPVAPTAIEIFADIYVGETGVLIGGDVMELSIETTPANGIKTVTWTSSDTSIATVSADGKVTGVKGGRVTITATSTETATVKDTIEVMVYEDLEGIQVLYSAMQYIKENTPEYAAADFEFPVYDNTLIEADYYDTLGNKFPGDTYDHEYVIDTIDTVKCVLTYDEEESIDFYMTVKVVNNLDDNEFVALNLAKAKVAEYLEEFDDNMLVADLALPATLTELLALLEDTTTVVLKEVNLTWASTMSTVLTSTGTYVRPNDDTVTTLEAYYVCGNNGEVTRHNITVKGYTQAEKIAFLQENTLPTVTELEGQNIQLPLRDNKFGVAITWTSDTPAVLSAAGKMDPYLTADTTVVLTAHITYVGIAEQFNFEQDLTFTILVKPATNDAQKVVLDLSNKFEEASFPAYFPWGIIDRVGGNVIPLPTTVGGDGTYKDNVVTWTAGEEGIFNETWELQKQFLRYHAVTMTYSVTVGSDTATGEIDINVGVAKTPDTMYVGGRFANRSATAHPQVYDELHTFSFDDPATGTVVGPYAAGYAGWTGFTFYADHEDATGKVVRYQYFANDPYTVLIEEGENGVTIAENGDLVPKMDGENYVPTLKTMTGLVHCNYQFILFINNTEKDINIPITYLNYKGSSLTKDVNGTTLIRQTSMSMDGWRIAFAADSEGVVTLGFGTTALEPGLIEAAEKDLEGNYTLPETIVLPAGGIMWSPYSSQNKAALGEFFCVVGTELTYEWFTPKY